MKPSRYEPPSGDELFENAREDVKKLWRDAKEAKRQKERKAFKQRQKLREADSRAQYE